MDEAPTVGIDLGTTYSCIAVYENNVGKIIPLQNGSNTMASCVSFDEQNGRLIGDDAKEYSVINPANSISGMKHFFSLFVCIN